MKHKIIKLFGAAGAVTLLGLGLAETTAAQEPSQDSLAAAPPTWPAHPADGRRQADLPVEAYAVVPGTRFLVRLGEGLGTQENPRKTRVNAATLEQLGGGGRR